MLNQTGLLGAVVASGLPVTQAAAEQVPESAQAPKRKLKVVVTGSHSPTGPLTTTPITGRYRC